MFADPMVGNAGIIASAVKNSIAARKRAALVAGTVSDIRCGFKPDTTSLASNLFFPMHTKLHEHHILTMD